MIRVGMAGYPAGSKGPVDAVERVAAMGLSAMEVQFVRQVRMAGEKAIEAGSKAKERGVLLSAHAPYYINFNSKDASIRRKSEEWVLKSARAGHNLGAWVVVVHAAHYGDSSSDRCTAAVMASLERCRARMEEEGVDDVLIGLECMGRRTAWGTLQEIGEVVGRIEGVVPVVDFAHLHARGGGSLRTEEDFRQVLEEVDRFYQGRLHCHFSGIEFTEVGERRHLPLSSRQPDYRMLAGALRERKGEVTLISETPSPADGAREMVSLLRTTHG